MVDSKLVDSLRAEPPALRVWSAPERVRTGVQVSARETPSSRVAPSVEGLRVVQYANTRSIDSRRYARQSSVPDAVLPRTELHHSLPLSYYSAPGFSPHALAHTILERSLPSLPARDADAALAALDATEAELRTHRDSVRAMEDANRDTLRVALQASSRVRAAGVLDADQAEEARAVAEEYGRAASNGLRSLLLPLRGARDEKRQMLDARDLVAALSGGSRQLDVLRAAQVLACAQRELAGENASVAIFDGSDEALERARAHVGRAIESLSVMLESAVTRAAGSADSSLVRLCILASLSLGQLFEARVVKAAVDAVIVTPADRDHPDHSSILPQMPSANESAQPAFQDPTDDGYTEEDLRRFVAYQVDVVEAARDFATRTMSWFPSPVVAHLHVVNRLVEHFIVPEGQFVLDRVEEDVRSAQRHLDLTEKDSSSQPSSAEHVLRGDHDSYADARQALTRARLRQLDVGASMSRKLAILQVSLSSSLGGDGVAKLGNSFDYATKGLKYRIAKCMEMEKPFLTERVSLAFEEIVMLEGTEDSSQAQHRLQGDGLHRYRTSFLRVAAKLPDMVSYSISLCYSAMRRCGLMHLQPFEPGLQLGISGTSGMASNAIPSEATLLPDALEPMREFCSILLRQYLYFSDKLVLDSMRLHLEDETANAERSVLSNNASPLASMCKTIKYIFESSRLVDSFFQTFKQFVPFKAEPRKQAVDDDETLIDTLIYRLVSMKERRALRLALRKGLDRLTVHTKIGVEKGIDDVRRCVDALLDCEEDKFSYAGDDSDDRGTTGGAANATGRPSYLAQTEPSMPFVSVAAFLEQQVGILRANLPPDNLVAIIGLLAEKTYESVLGRWRVLQRPLSARAGLQMVSDGEVVVRAFGELPQSSAGLSRIFALGRILSTPPHRLGKVMELNALAHVEAEALLDLIEKRTDCNAPLVLAARETLIASSRTPTQPP